MKHIHYRPKKKKCKNPDCGKEFMPYVPLQIVCSPNCALEFNSKKQVDKRVKEMKKTLVTQQDLIEILQSVFNTFIRLRDKDQPCISCGTTKKGIAYHAGHFYSAGNYSALRFHEDNVHLQCGFNCNTSKHGNTIEYGNNLVKKIGQERFDWLYDHRHDDVKLTILEIKEKIEYYKQEAKNLKPL